VGDAGADRGAEYETRAAILKKKAEVESIDLPDEVTQLLAAHIRTNVRELEGALMRLAAFASLKAEPITSQLARTSSPTSSLLRVQASIERIQEAVAATTASRSEADQPVARAEDRAPPAGGDVPVPRDGEGDLPVHRREVQQEGPHHRDRRVERVLSLVQTDEEVRSALASLTSRLTPEASWKPRGSRRDPAWIGCGRG